MNFIKKLNTETILISTIPLVAIFSIFFLELSLLIVTLFFFYDILKKKNFLIFNNFFIKFFLLFYLYILIRHLFSDFKSQELISIVFYFRYGFYVLAVFYFLNKYDYLEKYFLNFTICAFLLLVLDGFFQLNFEKNILGYPSVDNRITSFFNDESILGSYLIKFMPFLYLSIFKYNKNQKIFIVLIILLFLSNIIIFLSGERASFFLMILLTLYYIFMTKKFYLPKIIFLFILIFAIAFIFISQEGTKLRYLQTFKEIKKSNYWVNNEILDREYTIGNYYIISATHNNYFITAYRMFLDNKIFGQGPKSFRYLCGDERFKINEWSCSTHPHNYYLQLLAETGLIGFLIVFMFFLYILTRCLKILFFSKKNSNYIEVSMLAFFLINLWPLTSTGNFFNNWITILIFIPISFFLFYKEKNAF